MGPGRRVCITVRGRLSERLAAAFEGMTTVGRHDSSDLVGEVVDQAHLYGLLTRIHDLGLELESVNPVPVETSPRSRPRSRSARGASDEETNVRVN